MLLRTYTLTQTYLDCRDRIEKTVNKFVARYGVDKDEALSDANDLFIKAYDTYRDDKGMKFTTWLYYKIWKGLLENHRTRIGKAIRRGDHSGNVYELRSPQKSEFRMADLVTRLSADGKNVVQILLLHKVWRGMEPEKKHHLTDYLKKRLKWSKSRIADAYLEIEKELVCQS